MSNISRDYDKNKVLEILKRKQSNYIGFETILNIDLILVYLHKIPVLILNFIFHKLMNKLNNDLTHQGGAVISHRPSEEGFVSMLLYS